MFVVHLCNRKNNCPPPQNLKFCAIHLYHYLRQISYVITSQAYSYTGTRCEVKNKCTQNFLLPTPLGLEEPTMQLAEEKQVSIAKWRLCVSQTLHRQ